MWKNCVIQPVAHPDSSDGRALVRFTRGPGFDSQSGPVIFPHIHISYRRRKLSDKLQGSDVYGSKLTFTQLELEISNLLVYSSEVNIGTAVKCAYQLGTADPIKEVALTLLKIIFSAL